METVDPPFVPHHIPVKIMGLNIVHEYNNYVMLTSP